MPITMPQSPLSLPDSDEFDLLLSSHQGRLYGFIRSLVGTDRDCDELLQRTNERIIRQQADFELGTNFVAWAFQIAKNQVRHYRRQSSKDSHGVPFDEATFEVIAEEAEQIDESSEQRRRALSVCLAGLPDKSMDIVQRRYFKNESVQGIADELAMNPNAVSQLLFRVRQRLMSCIENNTRPTEIA